MKNLYLGLAIHNHQPADNFPQVFENAYQKAYLPFVEALERHPNIRLSLHYSGCLLDWLRDNRHDFLKRIANLVDRGQVEIMTGGYYEPILPMIPDDDKFGQIAKLTSTILNEFNFSATGLWLAERVWEPQLPKTLAQAGVQWTVVDDNHFNMVGFKGEDHLGYHTTEDEGHTIKIFSSSKKLRYSIPWLKVEEVIEYLSSQASYGENRIIVMGDDGEKFGLWPQTYQHCWKKGWMEDFLCALEKNSSWLKTIPLGEYAKCYPPKGMVYLPTASYTEMQEWALPAESSYEFHQIVKRLESENRYDITRYMHAGFWRYFLAKYPEINSMHKKMLRVHDKVYRALETDSGDVGLEELWRSQCNCPYWHGVFGGVYLNHFRHGVYRHLLSAENAADDALNHGRPSIRSEMTDFDSDTKDELLIEGHLQNLYFDLSDGASLFEWDLRSLKYNLGAVMTRRPEAYHHDLIESERRQKEGTGQTEGVKTIHDISRVKREGLGQYLHYDRYRRASLIDHFLLPYATIEDFINSTYDEIGDFVSSPYESSVKETKNGLRVHLKRVGSIRSIKNYVPFKVEKKLILNGSEEGMVVKYSLTNLADVPLKVLFGSEWNLSLTEAGHNDHCSYSKPNAQSKRHRLKQVQDVAGVETLHISDPNLELAMTLRLGQPARLWRFPIETVTNSEDGYELTFQGSCSVLIWNLELKPGEKWHCDLRWELIPSS